MPAGHFIVRFKYNINVHVKYLVKLNTCPVPFCDQGAVLRGSNCLIHFKEDPDLFRKTEL